MGSGLTPPPGCVAPGWIIQYWADAVDRDTRGRPRYVFCDDCGGVGRIDCPACDGSGEVRVVGRSPWKPMPGDVMVLNVLTMLHHSGMLRLSQLAEVDAAVRAAGPGGLLTKNEEGWAVIQELPEISLSLAEVLTIVRIPGEVHEPSSPTGDDGNRSQRASTTEGDTDAQLG